MGEFSATGRWLRRLGLVSVLAVLLSALLSAAAGARTPLPKGFPYAAEIQATIRYDGTYTRDWNASVPCGARADGSEIRVPAHSHLVLHFERTLFFRHITVPVALPSELGKAVARLGLEPEVTTPELVKSDHSVLENEFTATEGENEACHETPVATCFWSLVPLPNSTVTQIFSHDDGAAPAYWTIGVLGNNALTGECPTEEGSKLLSATLENAGGLYPPALLEGFPEVTISRVLGTDFHRLQTHTRSSFQVDVSVPAQGTSNCASASTEAETCTHGVSGRAEIELRRLFLYKSKHAYPR